MILPPKRKIKRYLKNDSKCPWCNSCRITGCGQVETDCSHAWQPITCLDCSAEWEDQYTLTGISCFTYSGERLYSDES